MDVNALLYYKSALRLKIPLINREQQMDGFEVVLGRQRYFFRGGETPFNFGSSLSVAANKYCMNKLLESSGLPVPKAKAFDHQAFKKNKIETLVKSLSFPLVAKPTMGTSGGKDVLCNITNFFQLNNHLKKCYEQHKFVSVEEFHGNLRSYRILIFYNKVIGVVERFSARVVGNGIHSINDLIIINNIEREKQKKNVTLDLIKIDEEIHMRLEELGITLDYVPKINEVVVLCHACNSRRGGTMRSLGKQICKENAQLLCNAAKILGLNFVGFDVVCEDILIPIESSRGVIIEANHNPDITIHEHPLSGIPVMVSKKMLHRLIFLHPLAYVIGLHKDPFIGFYMRLSLVFACAIALVYGISVAT